MKLFAQFLALVLTGSLILLSCTRSPEERQKRLASHVILIGVDGMSPDGVQQAETPAMYALMATGMYSYTARAVLPSSSGANWASMLNGAGPEQHGVISNSWRTDNFILPPVVTSDENKFPSLFRVIKSSLPDATLGAIYHWQPIENYIEADALQLSTSPETEEETTQTAIDFITTHKPDFTFIHLDHVDGAGHGFGHGSPEYYASVAKADSLIGLVVQATKDAGIFEETIFIISSDHGGLGKGHGGPTPDEMNIPWIISGKGIKTEGAYPLPVNTYDTPATILAALGLNVPFEWIGRAHTGTFGGQSMPAITFQAYSSTLKPVIYPPSDGYTPAGGLFVEETALLDITNPNKAGVIRYTTDGSMPVSDSPVFDGEQIIDRTTLVKARIFVRDKPASEVSTGYFRVLNDKTGHGVHYRTFTQENLEVLPDFSRLQSKGTGTTLEFDLTGIDLPQQEDVAAIFESYVDIETEGRYRFYLSSDDGSKLYVNDELVVDNDGDHGVIEKDASEQLSPGKHKITVEWFNGGGGKFLSVAVEGPGIPKQILGADKLYLNK
ncbi:MAG: alkaline phosphatase family protein [Bacteroidota bacterium]